MIETHRVVHIPAYDIEISFQSAVIYFSLKHWAIDSVDTYIADIVSVRVVILLNLSEMNSARKRKLAVMDPFNSGSSSSSPSKKT